MEKLKIVAIFLVAIAVGILAAELFPAKKTSVKKISASAPVTQEVTTIEPSSPVDLKINPPTEINGFSREEIYNLRKYAVVGSVFAFSGYDPSKSPVLEQIESGKPWIGLSSEGAYDNKKFITKGVSEETRFLNNPNILIGIALTTVRHCFGNEGNIADYTLPQRLIYSKQGNKVTVIYNFTNYYNKLLNCKEAGIENQIFRLTGVNARDLGYPFAYAYNVKNIIFTQQNNIGNEITEFQDFIHVGGSCEVPGGCNNGSPRQYNLEFRLQALPADIETYMVIKLWKERPSTTAAPADTILTMIFK